MPGTSPFPLIVPGQRKLSAAQLNRGARESEVVSRITGSRNITTRRTAGGLEILDTTPPRIEMKILSGSNPYAWTEVYWDGNSYVVDEEGLSGEADPDELPAYERNGSTEVTANTIVEGRLSPDGESYQFSVGGGGGGVATILKSFCRGGTIASLPPNSLQFVPFTGADQTFFDAGTPGVFTIPGSQPDDGYYQVWGNVSFTPTDCTARYAAHMYKNSQFADAGEKNPGAPDNGEMTLSFTGGYLLSPGDTVKCGVYHNSDKSNPGVEGFSFGIVYYGT